MDLAAAHDVVPMDQSVDQRLGHGAVGVVRLVHPVLCLFGKAHLGIVTDEVTAALQQVNEAAFKLLVIQCVVENGALLQPVPAGAEDAGVIHDVLIRQQAAGVGQITVLVR